MDEIEKFATQNEAEIRRRAPSLRADADLVALMRAVVDVIASDLRCLELASEHMRDNVNMKVGETSKQLVQEHIEQDRGRRLRVDAVKLYWPEVVEGHISATELQALCDFIQPTSSNWQRVGILRKPAR